tara:strand:- start:749 stop:1015 length:267 start_codon:yes stop_codon:yes gene_type:complete
MRRSNDKPKNTDYPIKQGKPPTSRQASLPHEEMKKGEMFTIPAADVPRKGYYPSPSLAAQRKGMRFVNRKQRNGDINVYCVKGAITGS